MKEFWSMVQLVFTGIGGWLGYFLEAKIVCGGAWGNDKMVWGFMGLGRGDGKAL